MKKIFCKLFFALLLATSALHATDEPNKLHFFSGLGSNIVDCFWGYNLVAWAAVPASTAVLVNTNVDLDINNAVNRSPWWLRDIDRFMLHSGNFTPIVPHAALFVYGYFWGSGELAAAGAAGIQAVALNGGIVVFMKWASGRPSPRYEGKNDTTPRDKEFNFNILEQSTTSGRWRWPSGHTSAMFAMVSSFHGFYPNRAWIPVVGYPFAAFMGMAMVNGSYHWFSDVTAGAIIGTLIGFTIGRNFRRMYEGYDAKATAADYKKRGFDWFLTPRQSIDGLSLALTAVF